MGEGSITVHHLAHADLAAHLTSRDVMVDAVIVDAPYSAKTHAGHDRQTDSINELKADQGNDGRRRRRLQYASWTAEDVEAFVSVWAPRCAGWFVSLTDDVLFPVWREAFRRAGLTCFADVPAVITGMTVRLAGDGPSSWAVHLAVARPKKLRDWGTLPGAYVLPSQRGIPLVGGKPIDLMRSIVRDYSRPGDLVCDPCCGAGTTLIAAKLEGRQAIGGDVDRAHVTMAERWLANLPPVPTAQGDLWTAGGER